MVILGREWVGLSVDNFLPATFAAVNARPRSAVAGLVSFVEFCVILLAQNLGILVNGQSEFPPFGSGVHC